MPTSVGVILLFVRGALLWVVVPIGLLCWIPFWPMLRYRKVRLGQFLGWLDLNLIAAIERSVLRPLFPEPLPWARAGDMARVSHRVRIIDPV